MKPRFLSIKNFESYQHYKHRNPPWIKLHLSILDDPDFLSLPDASKWHYIGLLLLASRHENAVKPDYKYITNRLGLTEKLSLSARFLKDHVLAPNASVLPTNADSESETEKSRVEIESAQRRAASKKVLRSITDEDRPTEKHRALARSLGVDLGAEWGKFKNYCLAHDKRYANFEAAFRNWIANSINMRKP